MDGMHEKWGRPLGFISNFFFSLNNSKREKVIKAVFLLCKVKIDLGKVVP
jgi:hypothetical protein